jgi:carboxyl-terminal processing protease
MQTTTQGQYGGVGLVIAIEDGMVKVVSPIDSTPAAKAGIKANDVIMAIDGASAQGLKLDDVQSKLRGPQGSKVTITVARDGVKGTLDFHLLRADVAVEPVTWRTEGDVGYIKIPAFNDHTNDGVQKAVAGIKAKLAGRLKGYILDLRDDGGGVLDAAIGVSDDFLDGGEIVSTRGRHPEDMQRYDAHPGDIAEGKPILILTNGGTASASEIVAGALQDHRRAKVVGTVSFGKGSVQTIIPLNDGEDGALHLTTGRYYAPSGRSIQTIGIIPDYPVAAAGTKIDPADLEIESEAQLPHHLPAEGPGSNAKPPALIQPPPGKTFDDFQLSYAISILDGTTLAKR